MLESPLLLMLSCLCGQKASCHFISCNDVCIFVPHDALHGLTADENMSHAFLRRQSKERYCAGGLGLADTHAMCSVPHHC